MTENRTRRQVLQSVSSAGAVAVFGTTSASASRPTTRLIEVGIRYDIPDSDDYVKYHVDSRPPYSVDANRNELVLRSTKSSDLVARSTDNALIDERPQIKRPKATVKSTGSRTDTLPTVLSARMRIVEKVQLAEEQLLPSVTIHWDANEVTATVEGHGEIELAASEQTTVELDPETAAVKTSMIGDEVVPIEGVPKHMWGPERAYGTVAVEVTPIVEIADYGELAVSQNPPDNR